MNITYENRLNTLSELIEKGKKLNLDIPYNVGSISSDSFKIKIDKYYIKDRNNNELIVNDLLKSNICYKKTDDVYKIKSQNIKLSGDSLKTIELIKRNVLNGLSIDNGIRDSIRVELTGLSIYKEKEINEENDNLYLTPVSNINIANNSVNVKMGKRLNSAVYGSNKIQRIGDSFDGSDDDDDDDDYQDFKETKFGKIGVVIPFFKNQEKIVFNLSSQSSFKKIEINQEDDNLLYIANYSDCKCIVESGCNLLLKFKLVATGISEVNILQLTANQNLSKSKEQQKELIAEIGDEIYNIYDSEVINYDDPLIYICKYSKNTQSLNKSPTSNSILKLFQKLVEINDGLTVYPSNLIFTIRTNEIAITLNNFNDINNQLIFPTSDNESIEITNPPANLLLPYRILNDIKLSNNEADGVNHYATAFIISKTNNLSNVFNKWIQGDTKKEFITYIEIKQSIKENVKKVIELINSDSPTNTIKSITENLFTPAQREPILKLLNKQTLVSKYNLPENNNIDLFKNISNLILNFKPKFSNTNIHQQVGELIEITIYKLIPFYEKLKNEQFQSNFLKYLKLIEKFIQSFENLIIQKSVDGNLCDFTSIFRVHWEILDKYSSTFKNSLSLQIKREITFFSNNKLLKDNINYEIFESLISAPSIFQTDDRNVNGSPYFQNILHHLKTNFKNCFFNNCIEESLGNKSLIFSIWCSILNNKDRFPDGDVLGLQSMFSNNFIEMYNEKEFYFSFIVNLINEFSNSSYIKDPFFNMLALIECFKSIANDNSLKLGEFKYITFSEENGNLLAPHSCETYNLEINKINDFLKHPSRQRCPIKIVSEKIRTYLVSADVLGKIEGISFEVVDKDPPFQLKIQKIKIHPSTRAKIDLSIETIWISNLKKLLNGYQFILQFLNKSPSTISKNTIDDLNIFVNKIKLIINKNQLNL